MTKLRSMTKLANVNSTQVLHAWYGRHMGALLTTMSSVTFSTSRPSQWRYFST